MGIIKLQTPLDLATVQSLKAGDRVKLSGEIYAARDAAHKKIMELMDQGAELPFDPVGSVIYYVGPTPPREGMVIGSAGPTTSGRMDPYTPKILSLGVKGLIGKGKRSAEVKEALKEYGGIYFAATGGAGALLSQTIKSAEIIAYEELGPEALQRFTVEEMPLLVVNDTLGNDFYEEGKKQYQKR